MNRAILGRFCQLQLECRLVGGGGDATLQLTSPEKVAELCAPLATLPYETVYWIALDTRKYVVAVDEVFKGTVDQCIAHPREIFRNALVLAPTIAGLLLVHNHPSGCCFPSEDDLSWHKRIQEAGELLGIPVVDCLVVARNGMWSQVLDGVVAVPSEYQQTLEELAPVDGVREVRNE